MRNIIVCLLTTACLTGCASVYTVSKHDTAARDRAALRARPLGPDGAAVEVDLAAASSGYWATWRDAPGAMTAATVIDAASAVLMGLGAAKIYEATQPDDDTEPGPYPPEPEQVPAIQASGETVVVIVGDGNSVRQGESAGGAE